MSINRWVPKEKKVAKIYKQIISDYQEFGKTIPEGYEKVVLNFAKIAVLLSDTDIVIHHLNILNELLKDKAKSLDTTTKNLKHNKVLRKVLEEGLEKVGFLPNFAKAIEYLEPETFRFFLRAGQQIKDPGVGVSHGEYSHPIQWWIIASQQKENPFLDMPIIDLYNELGKENAVYDKFYDPDRGHVEKNIWDMIVDQSSTAKDCRSPDQLQRIMLYACSELDNSLLRALMKSRHDKRWRNPSIKPKPDQYKPSDIDPKVLLPIATKTM